MLGNHVGRPVAHIDFPGFTDIRCLMMPFIQGDHASLPDGYDTYHEIVDTVFVSRGSLGFLTIDESPVVAGNAHRGARARHSRALHTEVGRIPGVCYQWGNGGGTWGGSPRVCVAPNTRILLANNLDRSCALWDAEHRDTSLDGDIDDRDDPERRSAEAGG